MSSAFEGGSTGAVQKVSDTHFRIAVAGQSDQNKRNRQANWYYFRVQGARPGQSLTFDIVDLPGEYNFKPNRGAITKDTPPVMSVDRLNWKHVESFEYDADEPKLRLRIMPDAATLWIAHTPPYTNEHLARLRSAVKKGRHTREEIIGKSVGGRDLFLWTIGRGEKTVWLMFRQHSWETGSSWVGDAAVRSVLENDRGIRWKILPMADPDGVATGGVRFNANGYDLNRNWDVEDAKLMPEIAAQRNAIATWAKAGGQVDLFLSLHNTETSEYLEGPPEGERNLAERFFASLKQVTTFHPSRPLFYAGVKADTGRMTVVQGLHRDFRIPAFLMEQRISRNERLGRLPTIADRVAFGRSLPDAIAAALTR